mgnify:CR=1 FL=1
MTPARPQASLAPRAAGRLSGSIVVKMALGEAPESIPVSVDIRRGRLAAGRSSSGSPAPVLVCRICARVSGCTVATGSKTGVMAVASTSIPLNLAAQNPSHSRAGRFS